MEFEIRLLDRIQKWSSPVLDEIMKGISSLGNYGILWIVLAVVLVLIPKTRKTGFAVAAALLLEGLLCNVILKNAIGRIRPYDVNSEILLLVEPLKDYSFPSGHTAASFSVVTALCFSTRKKSIWIPFLVIAILIAFSRLYLYVHYPTDVLGGVVLGFICGYLGWRLVDWLYAKIQQKRMRA